MYVMTAPIEAKYCFAVVEVGAYENFCEFLSDYPRMKKFYGDELRCSYISNKDYIPSDMYDDLFDDF